MNAKIAELDADFLGVSEYDPLFDVAGTLATNAVFAFDIILDDETRGVDQFAESPG